MKYLILLFLIGINGLVGRSLVYAQEYQKSYLSVKDGLAQNEVTSIAKDKFGFMWFGTRGGLNRYDGYDFKVFKPIRNDENSINNPSVESISTDSQGNILIGTKSGGVSLYDTKKEKFSSHFLPDSLQHSRVIATYEDFDKNIWIGTWSDGLFLIPANQDTTISFYTSQHIHCIGQSSDSTMWFGTQDGLKYLSGEGEIKTIRFGKRMEITNMVVDKDEECLWLVGWQFPLIKFNYRNRNVEVIELNKSHDEFAKAYSIMQDKKGMLWLGTWGQGLFKYNKYNKQLKKVNLNATEGENESNDYDIILDLFQDDIGAIWVGIDGGGIVRLSEKREFYTFSSLINEPLKAAHTTAVFEDSKNRLWIGTDSEGLYLLLDNALHKVGLDINDKLHHSDFNSRIKGVFEDKSNQIWVSLNAGLYIIDAMDTHEPTLVRAERFFKSADLKVISKAHYLHFEKDELWVGTQQNGLFLFKKKNKKYILVQQFRNSNKKGDLKSNRITSVLKDFDDNLWITTYDGIYRFNPVDSMFVEVNDMLQNKLNPLCEIVTCASMDNSGNIWYGTPCSLNSLSKTSAGKYNLTEYTRDNGLIDDYISSIVMDDSGLIWLSTKSGISCLNPKIGEFRNFDVSDGVGGYNFHESAGCKSEEGFIYFAGYENLTFFKPEEILDNKVLPEIVITDFKVLNKTVSITPDGLLNSNINDQQKIVLSHHEREFSFEFVSLDYKSPERNLYAYQLEGYNDNLVYIGNRRHISFSNLKPGNYKLWINGTNSNGLWSNKSINLDIEVKPAPWKTWYAIIGYILIILVVVLLISLAGVRQERLQNRIKLERIKREQEHELSEYKFRFFTNVSHELRTPLTLILAPINELMSKDWTSMTSSYINTKHRLIYQNANRLFELINQLLEFRRMEAGKLKLEATEINFKDFINELMNGFEDLSNREKVSFNKKFHGEHWLCFVDLDKMTVIISNLLLNAFKYVGNPGVVKVEVVSDDKAITFKISNNGKSISPKDIDHLFERFYQAGDSHHTGSSGIGLALVKNYIEIHKGEISVESIPNEFTSFTVVIKKGKEHLKPEEIRLEKHLHKPMVTPPYSAIAKTTRSINTGTNGKKVLVVEDNDEVRSYIVDLLAGQYQVIEASNGQEGYELVIEHKPAIVVSDVMMPVMDGFELCQKIKSNDTIYHIPVILLTAKGTPQDQLYGAKKGADVYLTKPFDPSLLVEKIKILISSRTKLSEKYTKKVILAPRDAEITSAEAQFVQATIKIIEDNMGDENFDSEVLAQKMAMSSSTFYRKAKKITHKTPGDFIKSIRMQRASQYLKESDISISEIAESIGYSDIKSFRKVFKAAFDLSPSEYRSQHKA